MGLIKKMVKGSIKIALAPIYLPLKALDKVDETLHKPASYEYWYHDSGVEKGDKTSESNDQRNEH